LPKLPKLPKQRATTPRTALGSSERCPDRSSDVVSKAAEAADMIRVAKAAATARHGSENSARQLRTLARAFLGRGFGGCQAAEIAQAAEAAETGPTAPRTACSSSERCPERSWGVVSKAAEATEIIRAAEAAETARHGSRTARSSSERCPERSSGVVSEEPKLSRWPENSAQHVRTLPRALLGRGFGGCRSCRNGPSCRSCRNNAPRLRAQRAAAPNAAPSNPRALFRRLPKLPKWSELPKLPKQRAAAPTTARSSSEGCPY
jgi:hypothetical protein